MQNEQPGSVQPQAPAPKKEGGGIKKWLVRDRLLFLAALVLLLALGVAFILFAVGSGRSAAAAVNRSVADDAKLQVTQEIVQISLSGGSDRFALFYINGEEGLCCATVQRGAAGYSVLDVSGAIPLSQGARPGQWMATAIGSGGREYLVFGMVGSTYSGVEVNGNPAVVVDTGEYRCWYYLGQGNLSINSESVVYK